MRYLPVWVSALLLSVINTLHFITLGWPWSIGTGETDIVASIEGIISPAHVLGNLHFSTTLPGFDWLVMVVIGVVLGSFLSAKTANDFKVRLPQERKWLVYTFIGGMLMGFGQRLAGGCNVGHLLAGVPLFSVASIAAAVFIVVGAYIGTKIIVRLV